MHVLLENTFIDACIFSFLSESVYESRPFVLSALIATVITFVFARFLQVSSRSRAASLTVLSSTISGNEFCSVILQSCGQT